MQTWIDVGAHLGQSSFQAAKDDSSLTVYAFEPLLVQAAQIFAKLPNYVVVPMAVTGHDGFVTFNYNQKYEQASSILPMIPEGVAKWKDGEAFGNNFAVSVPCIRLDTFIKLVGIECVNFLKIDAQGHDLTVVESLGTHVDLVDRIQLEVAVTDFDLYEGADRKPEMVRYLAVCGFELVEVHKQSHNQEENLVFERPDFRG